MSLLLETHTLLWLLTNDPKLSARARGAIENAANEAHISAASLWEVVIKSALGKHRAQLTVSGVAACGRWEDDRQGC